MQTNTPNQIVQLMKEKSASGKTASCLIKQGGSLKNSLSKDKKTNKQTDYVTRNIIAEGDRQFIELYSEQLRNVSSEYIIGESIIWSNTDDVTIAHWNYKVSSVGCDNFHLIQPMLKALKKTLKSENIVMNQSVKLKVGDIVIKIDKNLLETVLAENEITYMMTYQLDKKLKKKVKVKIENLIVYFSNICTIDVDDYELYIDRFYCTSLAEPLSVNQFYEMMVCSARILEQFTGIIDIVCEIRGTGIVINN